MLAQKERWIKRKRGRKKCQKTHAKFFLPIIYLCARERKEKKKGGKKTPPFFCLFFSKIRERESPPPRKKKTRKKHRGSRVVFRRTDASERFIQSAKKEGKMRRVRGCGEILALELYASRLSLFGANKKFWTFELPWPCFLSSSISFFF